jgi:hypothetical protein
MARAGTVYRSLQGQIKRKTEKALLFIVQRDPEQLAEEVWFPLSQLSSVHEGYDEINGTFDVIMASEWILGEKGMLSIAGAAGVNPVTAANIVKPVPANRPAFMDSPKDTRYNRMPYKDDERIIEDDIPF